MKFEKITVGFLEVNCYVIPSEKDNCVYIIDPGASPAEIAECAKSFGFNDYRILLTHAHIDHISGVEELLEALPVTTFLLHEDDLPLYNSPKNELPPLMPPLQNPTQPVHNLESCAVRVIHTPGHTRGGVCYYFEDDDAVFTGDTLFAGSIGRTDFPGGSMDDLLSSIRNKLFELSDSTEVFPGHGPFSTIGGEKNSNPFL